MAPIEGSVALVTGANRGLGRRFVEELLARGAAKVYAAARNPGSITTPGVVPIGLDVTDPAKIAAAAEATGDVDILINNAGSSTGASVLTGDIEDIRLEMETHYFGPLRLVRAFAPQLSRERPDSTGGGGSGPHGTRGAVLNVLSVLSWLAMPTSGAYCAAKAAAWSLTNSQRVELAGAGITVTALHVGFMDTDMTRRIDAPKVDPAAVAALALDAVAAGAPEVLADTPSAQVRAALAGGLGALYPSLAEHYGTLDAMVPRTG
ncbi:short-chain dehydrogenase [Frankia sp. CcI49]|uniref:SDR family oxidoreductase n=1 Tax=unclassified Frankia TaxID=2632575 RepID=UPI0006CA03A3|nr:MULTISPECIES: SDR family oxidoreductase [unclassified Frankia]KPM54852.1 short-chain dehydrogenase [Frankia sp. R43]ONH61045.1 short-chain dehydrogenase [Frankia sp. CcI49]